MLIWSCHPLDKTLQKLPSTHRRKTEIRTVSDPGLRDLASISDAGFPSTTSRTFLCMLPPLWPFSGSAILSCHRTFSHAIPSVWIMLLPLYYLHSWLLSSYNKSLSFTSSWHPFWLLLLLSFLALIMLIIFHLLVMIGECLSFLLDSIPQGHELCLFLLIFMPLVPSRKTQ